MAPLPSLASTLTGRLLSIRNPDGAWPYYSGKTSRLEPTCWALLALQASGERVPLDVLSHWPRRDGWFVDRSSDAVNVAFNGLTAVTLAALGAPRALSDGLRTALVEAKGEKIEASRINRQDNSLQGWAWTAGTFTWVEPTAWGLLGLKKLSGRDRDASSAARIAEGERVLADRVCRVGGWNHGNSNMLGTELSPYLSTSALGLIALGDHRDTEVARRTLAYVERERLSERSAIALGLTRIALGLFGRPARDVVEALAADVTRNASLGNAHAWAVAAYALSADGAGFPAFRL
jgi:hypothetical protein